MYDTREKPGTHSGKQTSKIDLIYATWFTDEGDFCVCVIGHSFDCHRLILKVYPHLG